MYAIYVRVPDFYRVVPHGPAWMNVTINRDRRALMAAVDGSGEFAFHTQLRGNEEESRVTLGDAEAMIQAAIGARVDLEILSRCTWTPGMRWWPTGSSTGGCSWAAMPRICSRRPAGSATTPRSRTPSISAGSWRR